MVDKVNLKKVILLWVGWIVLVLGAVFLLIPFIPLGYLFLFLGILLLSGSVPFVRKIRDYFKINKKKRKADKVRKKTVKKGKRFYNKIKIKFFGKK